MSILVSRCVKRSHVVEELLEGWSSDHREAMLASDIEELCNESVELCQLLETSWQGLFASLFEDPFFNTEVVGQLFQDAVRRSAKAVRKVDVLAVEAQKRGYEIEKADELANGLARLDALDVEVATKWPFVDRRMIEESQLAIERGEYQTIEELLHAAQSNCAGTDQPCHR